MTTHHKELFQKNLECWLKTHPPIDKPESSPWEFCHTGKKEQLNLKHSEGHTLHSHQNIDVEVRQWVGLFDPHKTEWLVAYGVGLGYYYLGLKNWLKGNPKRHVVFIEDDPAVLYAFFETDTAAELLQDSQAELIFYNEKEIHSPAFDSYINRSLFRELHIEALGSYQTHKLLAYEQLSFLIKFLRSTLESTTSEYLTLGRAFFKNYYHNLLELEHSLNGLAFQNKFKGVPAIICGAGPSLGKNIEVLKSLKDRALIFAGGTAMNALNAYGLLPHFGAGVDPFNFHYSRILANIAYETPFFYRSRMNTEAVALLHGPRLYLPGTTGYPLAEWVDNKLGFPAFKLDEGSNVINMSLSIAEKLGCNPILIVGLDLAYTDGLSYAPGITSHGIHDPREQFITKGKHDELILANDIYGKPIYTLMKWLVESSWYAHFARNFPDVKVINCTEGGIGFADIKNMPLKEASDLYLKQTEDLEGRISSCLLSEEAKKVPTIEATKEVLEEVVKDLTACGEVLKEIFEKFPHIWGEKLPPSSPLEETLKGLPGYDYLLKPFDESYQKYMQSSANTSHMQELMKGRFPYLMDIILENLRLIQKALKRKIGQKV